MRAKKRNYYYLKKKKEAIKRLLTLVSLLFVLVGVVIVMFLMHWNPFKGFSASWLSSVVKDEAPKVINRGESLIKEELSKSSEGEDEQNFKGSVIFRIGIMSDTHGATENIKEALAQMQLDGVDLVVHLGDFTAGGDLNQLKEAYDALESSGMPYRVVPGDHDFNWIPDHSYSNFEKYFGRAGSSVVADKNVVVIMYENATDTTEESIDWLKTTLSKYSDTSAPILFFSAKPLYSPYFKAKEDARGADVVSLLIDKGVMYAFAGDTHVYAQYKDLSGRLNMVTVGALGEYKNPLPQWVLVNIYSSGDIEVKPKPLVDF